MHSLIVQTFPDPTRWSPADVLSWLQWTSRQFGLSELVANQWDLNGASLIALTEDDFTRRSPQVLNFTFVYNAC